jgi:hypothetical protein
MVVTGVIAGCVVGFGTWLLKGWLYAHGLQERKAVPLAAIGIIGGLGGLLGVAVSLQVEKLLTR